MRDTCGVRWRFLLAKSDRNPFSAGNAGAGIAVDSSGNAYVTGTTGANLNPQFSGSALPSSDFPTTTGAFQATCPGSCTADSAWVTKLNASGSGLVYSTYLGGSGNTDAGTFGSIAVDSTLDAYVTGFTAATDFPTQNPVQKTSGGGTADAYVTELNSNGSAVVFSTYLGGSNSDQAISIALDKLFNMYVTGLTSSTNFPHTTGAFQTACPGSCTYYHGFVTKIGRLSSSTSLVSSLNPSIFGKSVTFTATVKSSTTGTPTGTVTFKDGTTTLGTSALSSGIAKFTSSTLTAGTHSITAVYGGDATFLGSTSAVLSQVVKSSGGGGAVTFTPTSLSFTQQLVGAKSAAKPVTLKNSGTGALTISSIVAVGNFSETNNCPASLAAGLTCTISVSFTPSISGKVLGEVTVTDNAPGTTQEIGLSGNGVTPLNFSPTSLSFGTVTVGTTTAAKIVTVINNSTTSLTMSRAASGGYAIAATGTTCVASLAAKAKCNLAVTFTPHYNGVINGAVTLTYNAGFSPVEVPLSGSGTGGAVAPLTFTPTSLSFASQLTGTTSAAKVVTVTNSSAGSVTINSISASGDYSAVASGTTPCSNGLALAATHTCTFSVTFKPSVNGTIPGTVWIADSSTQSPQVLTVTGKGVVSVSLSPSSLNFGTVSKNTVSAPKTITVTNNNQSTAVTITGIAVSGDYKFAAGTCTGSIAAKSKCTFSVSFAPLAAGLINGVASVSYASGGSPQVVNLSGTGQ